jgi:hypothetical protein
MSVDSLLTTERLESENRVWERWGRLEEERRILADRGRFGVLLV